ncbi:putative monooxygenase [Moniliophthora roreri MCA 2997]|uniref:Monooxygenase n=2 Tax=Moniliophthora roreri TaxID=221103 RepID=V2WKI1_MONRO|nr:putative monooxygenase [Moniliophthora roreri MCA 2997]
MVTATINPPVLIVGAGPSGLALGLALLQNGVTVRIIDKIKGPQIGQRGAATQPRALELYGLLGVLPDILNKMGPFQKIAFHDGANLVKTWDLVSNGKPSPDIPYPDLVMIGQDQVEGVLRSHLEGHFGVKVDFGVTLKTFEQHDRGVSARVVREQDGRQVEETWETGWLVGADGAKGVIRKQLGFTYLGETRDHQRFIIGDVHILEGIDKEYSHRWGDMARNGVGLRPTESSDSLFQYIVGGTEVPHDEFLSDHNALLDHIVKATGRNDIKFGELVTIEDWRPNVRMANKLSEGRVFIVGDAAHIHSSSGGQGIISCLQDIMNLSWKLGLVERGFSPLSLLDTYDQERLPVIAEMLKVSTGILDRVMSNRFALADAGAPDIRQFGVNYRWSSIVVDVNVNGGSVSTYGAPRGDVHAGDRAPDSSDLIDVKNGGKTTSIFELLTCSKHTALVFVEDLEEAAPFIRTLEEYPSATCNLALIFPRGTAVPDTHDCLAFHDSRGYAYRHYLAYGGPKVVVVRPDGVVGAVCKSTEGLKEYRIKIFAS